MADLKHQVAKPKLSLLKKEPQGPFWPCLVRGHPEVEGTMGQFDASQGGAIYLVETVADVAALPVRNPQRLAYVTQTTLSVDDTAAIIDALRQTFPAIQGPRKDDICYATQNRQDAVRELASDADVISGVLREIEVFGFCGKYCTGTESN